MSSCFSIKEVHLGFVGMIQLWIWMTKITYVMMDDLMSFDLFNLSHIRCHTGAYLPFRSRFVDLCGFAWPSLVVRYMSGGWFDFILSCFSDKAFLGSFSQAHTSWRCCDLWIKLFQVHWFLHHCFSRVHVRSFIHPCGVILELSRQTKYIWCHTGAYFPSPVVEVMVFSQICYSLHCSAERYFIGFTGHYSCDFRRDEPSARDDLRVLTVSLSMILQ